MTGQLNAFDQTEVEELPQPKTNGELFNEFHRDNKHVYFLYRKFAFQLIESGHKRLGSKMIVERIRYETAIKTTDQDYKINNDFTAHLARLFVRQHPEHSDKFVFKKLKKV